jgi:membrane-associated phospholipid phosphatase
VLLLALRQIMQAICALPAPSNMIWHYPGFPSLLVTYNVGNDFFFSGHTAIAVFGGIELARLGKRWLTIAAVGIVLFEIATVLILRAHYTMDVFTGLIAALWVSQICAKVSPPIDAWLSPVK